MNWGHLFFGFNGRINRAKYWIAILIYLAIYLVLAVIGYATDQSATYQAINGMLNIVIFISSLAVGIKRLHDRNKSGWYLVLFYIVPGVLMVASILAGVTTEETTMIGTILGLMAFAIGVWAFVELGCLRGTVGANQYGADPVAPATVPPVRPRFEPELMTTVQYRRD
jgi:uncharacterized membrane protein YhaH (DUF805 family)